jgi:hypothetical protein
MYKIKNSFIIVLTLVFTLVISCKDLDEMNINPNGVLPEQVDPNLLMPTIITSVAKTVVNLGYGDIAGVMQHTQKDGWSGGHNDYNWDNSSKSWNGYYAILSNNNALYSKSDELKLDFHKGVALVMRAYTFGLITDLWGDAPYSEALNGELLGDNLKPVFDDQADIYAGILADLDSANTLLSKGESDYSGINKDQDPLYGGKANKWRKFANSLALRYYMRLSVKNPTLAGEGISNITDNPEDYPIITEVADEANISYIGSSPDDSWPNNTVYDDSKSGSYFRTKMCATLVETLQAIDDPRLAVWANKIEYRIEIVPALPDDKDDITDTENGVRYILQSVADKYEENFGVPLDLDPEYVGIPPSLSSAPQYNLNPDLEQGVYNQHVSQLSDIYTKRSDPLLLSRMMSAAEVNFILAEAALSGWAPGAAKDYYEAGIKASLDAWGVGDDYDTYILEPLVSYNGTLGQLIQQKWIASWTAAAEAWFDWRRTGLPVLQAGDLSNPNFNSAKREALPLRFYYHYDDEIRLNPVNATAAIDKLVPTDYNKNDSKNSAWSKMWLLQGTGNPY